MDLLGREIPPVGADPVVGGKVDPPAALLQGDGKGLGREQMAAGAARRDKDNPSHGLPAHAAPELIGWLASIGRLTGRGSGRRRVKASSNPIPKATASIDEPP